MKFGFLLAGLFFLFNPNLNLVDLLPDAIGYGLIFYGILRISRADARFDAAGRYFKWLFILELCKLPSLYVYALISENEQIWILILSLLFGILEAVFGLMAWKSFFEGINYFAQESETGGREKWGTVRILTFVFTLVKPLFCILPDLTLLDDDRYGTVIDSGVLSLQTYRGAFTIIAALLVLAVGLVWLTMTFSYLRRVKREQAFVARLEACCEKYYREKKEVFYSFLASMLSLLAAAALFCLELKAEGYSLLPPMINGALFFLFFFLVRKHFDKWGKIGLAASGGWLVFSTVGWVLAFRFTDKYYLEGVGDGFSENIAFQIENHFGVLEDLEIVALFVLLANIAFVLMLVALKRLFSQIIESYTGLPESSLSERDQTEAMRMHDEAADRAVKAGLHRSLKPFFAVGILSALSSAAFPLLQIFVPVFFTIDLLIRILFVVLFFLFAGKLKEAVTVKGGIEKI